jgi:hypothetical protein|tara:strand:+ start:51 stop:269 length:219 start_codon:yes stop_codon:yes gene_type:complete
MKYITEIRSINDFDAWSGAKDTLQTIREHDKIDDLECFLEDLFHDRTPTETEINDFLWFESEYIYTNLNIEI